MNIRLKDIAKEAGVSISTVSRVLNDPNTTAASTELQERIWEIVHRTGYSPNREAQLLKNGKNTSDIKARKSINCLIACSAEEIKDDSFYTQILSSIERESYHNNYILESTYFARDIVNPETIHRLQESPRDNLIVIGRFMPSMLDILKKGFRRIIYTGLNDLDVDCDQILCDGYSAIKDGVRYLYEQGHNRIGLIGNEADNEARCRGYFDGMKALDLPVDRRNVITDTVLSLEGGQQGMGRLVEKNFNATAVICVNDMVAMGVIHACKRFGIQVPKDLSVMGMNDIETVQYISPMLTTIHVPMAEMGKVTVRILLDRIDNGHSLPMKICLPYYIVTRESTRGNPKASGTGS